MADLRAIAEAAIPAPWASQATEDRPANALVYGPDADSFAYLSWNPGNDYDVVPTAAHIAAWSPDRALAALDVIEAARLVRNDLLLPFGAVLPHETRHPQELDAALDRWDALTPQEVPHG